MGQYIEKLRVPVRMSQPGCMPEDGYVALAPQAKPHPGPETILERLNATDRVIPFQRGADDGVLLVNRADIEWVAADPAVASHLVCPPTYQVTCEEEVRIRLRGGGTLEGRVQMELPADQNRASDFMNGAEDFFPLLTPFGILIVNKQLVSRFELTAPSPLPPSEYKRSKKSSR